MRTRKVGEFLRRDRHELHLVARVEEKRIRPGQIERRQRRAADDLPSARSLAWINSDLNSFGAIGTNSTSSPEWRRNGSDRDRSNVGSGVRPMICHPPGVSLG